ncbi:MAG: hypothetical protein HDQ88_01690 [Clostridia bacterium]|nr:hypothetical protein [Clostridia bacterium]
MKTSGVFSMMAITAVILWSSVFCLISCSIDKSKQACELAQKGLLATVDNPETVEIIAISEPDSVFGRDYISQEEKMNLAVAMMKVNQKVMEQTENMENLGAPNSGVTSLMERQMAAASALRSVNPFSLENSNEKKPFSGWKVKVEYTAKTSDGLPYHSEYWCIIDKDVDCVVNSFDIPIL